MARLPPAPAPGLCKVIPTLWETIFALCPLPRKCCERRAKPFLAGHIPCADWTVFQTTFPAKPDESAQLQALGYGGRFCFWNTANQSTSSNRSPPSVTSRNRPAANLNKRQAQAKCAIRRWQLGKYFPDAVDSSGDLFIADTGNNRIREVINPGPTLQFTNISAANAGTYDVVVANAYGSVTSRSSLPPRSLCRP